MKEGGKAAPVCATLLQIILYFLFLHMVSLPPPPLRWLLFRTNEFPAIDPCLEVEPEWAHKPNIGWTEYYFLNWTCPLPPFKKEPDPKAFMTTKKFDVIFKLGFFKSTFEIRGKPGTHTTNKKQFRFPPLGGTGRMMRCRGAAP